MTSTLLALFFCLVVPALLFVTGFYIGRHGSPVRVQFGYARHAAPTLDDLDDDGV